MASRDVSLIPPADLLDKLQGVEPGLRRLHGIGELSSAGSLLATVLLVGSWALRSATSADARGDPLWLVSIVATAAVATFVLIWAWSKLRLSESKTAFRYTCSVLPFEPVEFTPRDERMTWIRHDLERLLSERVSRFLFLNDVAPAESSPPDIGTVQSSQIEISGRYVIRTDPGTGMAVLEVIPRIALGNDAGVTLAHRVKYSREGVPPKKHLPLSREEYGTILERVYFHVATKIYEQIEGDVERKIALMPTAHLRGVALFHEAYDYSRSNTLYAYERAGSLFERAVTELAPSMALTTAEISPWRRLKVATDRPTTRIRLWIARLLPQLAARDVIAARSLIGYARARLYRQTIAYITGHRTSGVFDGLLAVKWARERMDGVPKATEGRTDALFDIEVTSALAHAALGDNRAARVALARARRISPARAEEESRFVYAFALTIPDRRSQLATFRRAAELDDRFQMAQAEVAFCAESLWRPRAERGIGVELVLREYERVLDIDPSHLAANANLGYINWLIGDLDQAELHFLRAREYKEIKADTFVSEIDYGLARIAAERGKFANAYRHYAAAMVGLATETVAERERYTTYHFEMVGPGMMERFDGYRDTVERKIKEAEAKTNAADPGQAPERVIRSVDAFVLNDYGDCSYNYYLKTGNTAWLTKAESAYRLATQRNAQFSLPWLNLWRLKHDEDVLVQESATDAIAKATDALTLIRRFRGVERSRADGVLAELITEGLLAALQLNRIGELILDVDGSHDQRAQILRSRSQLCASWKAVQTLAFQALPHERLWEISADGRRRRFRWEALPSPDSPDPRWLREIGAVGTETLLELGRVAWWIVKRLQAIEKEDGPWARAVIADLHIDKALLLLTGITTPHVYADELTHLGTALDGYLLRLFDFIRTWYRPADLGGLETLLELQPSPGKTKIRRAIRGAVDDRIAANPDTWWAATWIATAYSGTEAIGPFTRAVDDSIMPPMSLARYLGDELVKLAVGPNALDEAVVAPTPHDEEAFAAGRRAYERGLSAGTDESAEELSALADRFARLFGDTASALDAVRRGRQIDKGRTTPFKSQDEWRLAQGVIEFEVEPELALRTVGGIARGESASMRASRTQFVKALAARSKQPHRYPTTGGPTSYSRVAAWLEKQATGAGIRRDAAGALDAQTAAAVLAKDWTRRTGARNQRAAGDAMKVAKAEPKGVRGQLSRSPGHVAVPSTQIPGH